MNYQPRSTAASLKSLLRAFTFLFLIGATATGCSDDQKKAPPPPQKVIDVRLLHPIEASEWVEDVARRVAAASIKTQEGYGIRIVPAASAGFKGSLGRLSSGDLKPTLWLALSDYAVQASTDDLASLTASVTDCVPLFSTKAIVVHRSSDSFEFSDDDEHLPLVDLLNTTSLDSEPRGKPRAPFVVGHPLYSSSGLTSLLLLSAAGLNTLPFELTPDRLRTGLSSVQRSQDRVLQYMYDDRHLLSWLGSQEGGTPVLALSNSQQFAEFTAKNPDSGLQSREIVEVGADNNYPVCQFEASWITPDERSAARALHDFLRTDEVLQLALKRGFSPPKSAQGGSQTTRPSGPVASFLAAHWPDIRRPIALSLVVDASVSMEGAALESLQRDFGIFCSTTDGGAARNVLSLVTFASEPTLAVPFTTDTKKVVEALNHVHGSGGSAFYDGITKAIEQFNDSTYPDYRRVIFVVTDGRDTASRTALESFQMATGQLLNRKKIILYVVGIGKDVNDYGDIPKAIKGVGGLFRSTKTSLFSTKMFTVWPELR